MWNSHVDNGVDMKSEFLNSRKVLCKVLVDRLLEKYEYASVLGKQITGKRITVSSVTTNLSDSFEEQCGFVCKIYNGKTYAEYSFSDITVDSIDELGDAIERELTLSEKLANNHVDISCLKDERLVAGYERTIGEERESVPAIIDKLTKLRDMVASVDERIIQVMMRYEYYDVSAFFVSGERDLTQDYSWNSIFGVSIAREGDKIQQAYDVSAYNSPSLVFQVMEQKAKPLGQLSVDLLHSELIEPGVYDIITAPSISGLIAHEAFGHGVEMDMFVKNRAKAARYVGQEVAAPLVNMHDGAVAVESCVGYFFDDDGVMARDTLIIKDGILQTGISDAVSAAQLGTTPTGNGRRQDPSRKSYSRMTNTFFSPGKDKLEDMIASIEHGYMLFQTDNGMEDPKNWNIQCVAQYGREIRDGKFTGRIVAPVVMSGYVPDLLKSITMVSEEFEVIGSGHCGKGYKEWVPVSDGGPYLKTRCKLG